MKRTLAAVAIGVACLLAAAVDVRAEDESTREWRFPIHVSYVDGFSDVGDYYEDLLGFDTTLIPVGVAFSPYLEFDYSAATGSAVGMQIGPTEFIYWEVTNYGVGGSSSTDNGSYVAFPLILYYGQVFVPKKSVSPYVKIGYSFPVAFGDEVGDTTGGLFAAIGMEFMRKKIVGLGFEFAIDESKVTFDPTFGVFGNVVPAQEVKPFGFTASFKIVF